MPRSSVVYAILLGCFAGSVWGQRAVDPANRYYRVIALVHLTGTGKPGDPIRPEYVPNNAAEAAIPSAAAASRPGIIAWSMQLTDDKHMAIVHLVAVDHHAFDAILSDQRPEVKVFEVGKHSAAAIETALGPVSQGFNLSNFQVLAR